MFYLIVHNVRSIFNVGSMFRTADGVGVDRIYLTGYTPGPDTHGDKMAKTALGAELMVPWERVKRVGDLVRKLKQRSFQFLALEQTKDSVDYRMCKPAKDFALIVGNEVRGMPVMSHNLEPSKSRKLAVDAIIEIPMRGQKESLNVAVACGIALYELTRRIKKK